jgi:hypothetical protein
MRYVIQGNAVTRPEMERIVQGLAPVTEIAPTSRLPRGGGLPLEIGLVAGVGLILAGGHLRWRHFVACYHGCHTRQPSVDGGN